MWILENAFLVHTYMMVRRYRENVKPQAIIIIIIILGSYIRLYADQSAT